MAEKGASRLGFVPLLVGALFWLVGACSDDSGGAGRDAGTERRDGGARDSEVAQDGGSSDAGSPDGGPPPSGWAPQPWEDCEGGGRELQAEPSNYRDVLSDLGPGDVLKLAPGTYTRGLPLSVSGEQGRCIVIEAQDPADPPVIQHGGSNTIDILGASWIKLRNLVVDSKGDASYDGVKAKSEGGVTHHVVIEGCRFVGQGGSQQTVAISTKAPAVDWVIRGNRIEGAGTGLYLGNSDGTQPFVRGVIEFNLVLDTIGYNMQIKHQLEGSRDSIPNMPQGPSQTVVRYNVFAKRLSDPGPDGARPNVLFGHFPLTGLGSEDTYLFYGNFLYDNPTERLLQAEGNVSAYANVFVNPHGDAVSFQAHNDKPRRILFFFNTVVASGLGVGVSGGDPGYDQTVFFNAVYAATPLRIRTGTEHDNATGSLDDAASVFVAPGSEPGAGLDLHPRPEALGAALDLGQVPDLPGALVDFDGRQRAGGFVGAYEGPAGDSPVPLELAVRDLP